MAYIEVKRSGCAAQIKKEYENTMKDVLEQAGKMVGAMNPSDKAEFMERQLHLCAGKRNVVLELRITDDPWFK